MLSQTDNALLTQVEPGTPMGETLRRYWVPALLTREVAEADGPPVRVKILGEELVGCQAHSRSGCSNPGKHAADRGPKP
jgi:hypothetical protein